MDKDQGVPTLLLLYFSITAVLALVCAYGYTKVTVAGEQTVRTQAHSKTILDERIANAREIKAALAKPQPKPEPLPPITEKVANPPSTTVVTPEKPLKLPRQARNAMAMAPTPKTIPTFASVSGSSSDRGIIGGC